MNETDGLVDWLRPHEGDWTRRHATHLLWRAQFGATHEQITQSAEDGLQATLDRLLTPQQESAEFESTEALLRRFALDTGSIDSLKMWWLYRMMNSANPVVEKMALFWHNHFATSHAKVQSVEHMAVQNDLIRRHALGRFRELLHGMSRDVAMLTWLDGNANRKRHPNENFAREVMELFSLEVGNYTERDIQEAARAFTGWHVRQGKFWFNRIQHDSDDKTVLGRSGSLNGDDVIDLCLEQDACARFLASKLLRYFVAPAAPGDAVEQLARRLRLNDFEMRPVLAELLGSELFHRTEARHAIIKSPLDLVLGAQQALGVRPEFQETAGVLAELGQDVFEPPTVKGWEGGRLWITSASMLQRSNFAAALAAGEQYGTAGDPSEMAKSRRWNDPESLIEGYVDLLLSRELDAEVSGRLAGYLRQSKGGAGQRIRGLIHLIMTMPEYQLM